jgi:hypothetical protein
MDYIGFEIMQQNLEFLGYIFRLEQTGYGASYFGQVTGRKIDLVREIAFPFRLYILKVLHAKNGNFVPFSFQ